ncbi:hypothetical protein HPP92_019332 [Vanilla planifolia]|uniref:Uncharacterized protein n=1 Tax=Vanilla planifolia TaxID=51239 RepID=A0A835Q690_VANPL|nr:hypothetical protein HPP92_019332 [Vanilla planifolia]
MGDGTPNVTGGFPTTYEEAVYLSRTNPMPKDIETNYSSIPLGLASSGWNFTDTIYQNVPI